MMKLKHFQYEVAALVGAALVLWQLLLRGYVLSLDMVFGPVPSPPVFNGLSSANVPLHILFSSLRVFLSGWVVEKIFLFVLFFLLFYLPLRFYPFVSRYGERYAVAIFFAINPFVYERFLAGQWGILFGYALLFLVVALLIKIIKDPSWKRIIGVFVCLWLIGIFTLHFEVMGVIATAIAGIIAAARFLIKKDYKTFWSAAVKGLVMLLVFLAASSYWLIPTFTAKSTVLDSFTAANWQAYSTAGTGEWGTLGNVLTLYGFWEEHEPWIQDFYLPARTSAPWIFMIVLFALVIGAGKLVFIRDKDRWVSYGFLAVLALIAIIFSAGIGPGIFHGFNLWIFEHVKFWRGFRDTEKWSGLLALIYVLLYGVGAGWILSKGVDVMPRQQLHMPLRIALLVMFCLLPIAYMPTEIFGFVGQLQPVQYPQSWAQANAIIKQDPSCKALFLPWHEYYSLDFDDRRLVANTAPSYFNCTIISSADAEIGAVGLNTSKGPAYAALDAAISSNTTPASTILGLLKAQNIKYVIFSTDEILEDPYRYLFLHAPEFHILLKTPSLVLYQVVW